MTLSVMYLIGTQAYSSQYSRQTCEIYYWLHFFVKRTQQWNDHTKIG